MMYACAPAFARRTSSVIERTRRSRDSSMRAIISRVPIRCLWNPGSTAMLVICPSSPRIITPPYPTTFPWWRATKYAREPFCASSERKSPADHGRGYTFPSMRRTAGRCRRRMAPISTSSASRERSVTTSGPSPLFPGKLGEWNGGRRAVRDTGDLEVGAEILEVPGVDVRTVPDDQNRLPARFDLVDAMRGRSATKLCGALHAAVHRPVERPEHFVATGVDARADAAAHITDTVGEHVE